MTKPKFKVGTLLSTIPAHDLVLGQKLSGQPYLMRHVRGDAGDANFKIKAANKIRLNNKIESHYLLPNGRELAVVTDLKREFTIFCLPGEDFSETLRKAGIEST
jgi:hypothetical protein